VSYLHDEPASIKDLVQRTLEVYGANVEARIDVLEKRVVAAEATSVSATAQMTAVLAVLNVLAQYKGPPVEAKVDLPRVQAFVDRYVSPKDFPG
jgi:hypothetical protein